MEARRNLEGIYKRRLDEVDAVRFQAELHLQILKQYIKLVSGIRAAPDMQRQIDALVSEFVNKITELTSVRSDIGDWLWNDTLNIARSQLDQLSFNPVYVRMGQVRNLMVKEMALSADMVSIPENLLNACLNVDVNCFTKVCRALHTIFSTFAFDVEVSSKPISTTGFLTVEFREKNNKFFLLSDSYKTSMSVFNHQAPSTTRIDDDVVMLFFICKSLLQGNGGDISYVDDRLVVVDIPGEVVDDSKCLPVPVSPEQALPTKLEPSQPQKKAESEFVKPEPSSLPLPPAQSQPQTEQTEQTQQTGQQQPPLAQEPARTLEGRTLNILMAEDDPISRKIFKRFWNEKGHNVFTAADGVEAFELFKKQRYSIVFLDVQMPFRSGIETANDIRHYEKENGLTPTPIIGVSGYTTKQYREQALASGMNEFISKGQGYQWQDIYNIVLKYCGAET